MLQAAPLSVLCILCLCCGGSGLGLLHPRALQAATLHARGTFCYIGLVSLGSHPRGAAGGGSLWPVTGAAGAGSGTGSSHLLPLARRLNCFTCAGQSRGPREEWNCNLNDKFLQAHSQILCCKSQLQASYQCKLSDRQGLHLPQPAAIKAPQPAAPLASRWRRQRAPRHSKVSTTRRHLPPCSSSKASLICIRHGEHRQAGRMPAGSQKYIPSPSAQS